MKYTHKVLFSSLLFFSLTAFLNTANTALVSRLGGQAVYDTESNLTWIADGNLALSNPFGVDYGIVHHGINAGGRMSLFIASQWILGMNNANYLGVNDWRFPRVGLNRDDFPIVLFPTFDGSSAFGVNITRPGIAYAETRLNEMAYLFYNSLGNISNYV